MHAIHSSTATDQLSIHIELFLPSTPTSACTIVADPTCRQVRNIVCDDVPPSSGCKVRLRRTFMEPGTYCVNITLEDATSLALASTTITIGSPDTPGQSGHMVDMWKCCPPALEKMLDEWMGVLIT